MALQEHIISRARELRDETAECLSALVRTPSLSGHEAAVIGKIGDFLNDAGCDAVRVDDLGNLIATVGAGTRKLAIDAHVDTVDTGDPGQWQDDPFSGLIREGWVHGRGSVDQKGGAAGMITAARILKEVGYDGPFTVYFTFTIMEEDCEGLCWNYLIENENLVPDFAVITEPTALGLYRGHRGRLEMDITVRGRSAHGSAPERGDNAIYTAAGLALETQKLNTQLADDPFLGHGTVAATRLASDSPSLCAIPDSAALHLDRRLTWGETMAGAVDECRRMAGKIAGTKADLRVPMYSQKSYKGLLFEQQAYFPAWKLGQNHPLVTAGIETRRLLIDEPPQTGRWTFSTNGVALCGKHNIPTIGFGPGDEVYAHGPNERVPADHLDAAAAFYALLPYMLERRDT